MKNYCGKTEGTPGSQITCASPEKGWSIQCPECRIKDLEAIVGEVHSWIVCAAIAPPEDLLQNADRIALITAPDYDGE